MKLTKHKLSIIMLALVLILALTAFIGLNTIKAKATGTVTVSGTNVFTSTENASVGGTSVGEGDSAKYYTTFTFTSNDDTVSYRRNLAYFWWANSSFGASDGDDVSVERQEGKFSMKLGFKNVDFEKFTITFESQPYNKNKDSKSVNYISFFPAEDGKVYVCITDDKEATVDDVDDKTAINAGEITIEFTGNAMTDKTNGEYGLTVGNDDGYHVGGFLKNVGGNYSKSSTSSSSPVYPLIFNAEFDEESEENKAEMVLYSLNGQSFENTSSTSNTVTDDQPAVLCLNEDFRFFTPGSEVDVDFVVIDVLRSSPSSTVNYYILSVDQYKDTEIADYNDKELFAEVEDDTRIETDIDKYLPVKSELGSVYDFYSDADGKFKVDMAVKVYVTLTDISSSDNPTDIYLDWYIPEEYLITLFEGDRQTNFIAVAKDELGVKYAYDGEGNSWKENGKVDAYQQKIDDLAKDLSAGSSSYIYLPSAESLFEDNANSYTDLKFSIYYYHNSQQSSTGLASNNLSINITQPGDYTFTIYATDAAGNDMYYVEDGEIVEFSSSKIWTMYDDQDENGDYNKLPWFHFYVSYTGVSFEETPGMQSTAYVGTNYTSASFKINGISGSYSTVYSLYVFDRAEYYKATGVTYSYEQFIEVMDDLFTDPETRKYFAEIPEVGENDADYETYKDYEWSSTSTSFTPQDTNSFYYIRAEVTDTQYNSDPVTCSLAVVAAENSKTIKGESDWLKNNVASVVLLVVAGLAFIGIILLLVIKPKDKGDIDVQYENVKNKKK